jgi:hypothetical protein
MIRRRYRSTRSWQRSRQSRSKEKEQKRASTEAFKNPPKFAITAS